MDSVFSDVLIVGRDNEAALFVSKHLQKCGYSYELTNEPRNVAVDSSFVVAVVCCSHEEMNAGLEHVAYLAERGVSVLVIMDAENQYAVQILQDKGATAVCALPFDAARFQDAFDTIIYQRELKKNRSSMGSHAQTLQQLTPRERRIVQLAADGKPNKQIATNVGLSVKSIERIRRDAYRKLKVRSVAEMTRVFLLGSLYPELGGPSERVF